MSRSFPRRARVRRAQVVHGASETTGGETGYVGGKFGLQKTFGPLLVQPDVAVLLDADVIVLKPLTDLLQDKPVFFIDALPERSHPDWACLGYARASKIPYVNAGHLIISRSSGRLTKYNDAVERMLCATRLDPTKCRSLSDPFYFGDQDALNALLESIDPSLYILSEEAVYWPFEGPLNHARFLHHILAKPWVTPMRSNAYVQHMVRVLAEVLSHYPMPNSLGSCKAVSPATSMGAVRLGRSLVT